MIVYEDIIQGSREWADIRMGRPTASEFHRIITAVKAELSEGSGGYIDQLISETILVAKGMYPERIETFTSRPMDHGRETEEEARLFLAKEQPGMEVRKVGFITTDDGRFGASPDSLLWANGGWVGGAEIKCPTPAVQVKRLREGRLPNESKAQVHGSLAVSGLPFWDYLSYCDGLEPFLLRVVPGPYTVKLTMALQSFWANYQAALAKVRSM